MRSTAPLLFLVGSRCQHLVRPKLVGDLLRPPPFHAHLEDAPYHLCGLRVNQPVVGILRVFHIAIGDIDCQRYAALTFRLLNRPDFTAGIPAIKFVKPVLDARKIVVDAVLVGGVEVIIDGDKPNAVLREGEVGVKPSQCRVPPQTTEVFRNTDRHSSRFDFGQHRLETGAVIGYTTVAVINEKLRIAEMVVFAVAEQDSLLILDRQGLPGSLVLLRQAAVEGGDFARCS